MRNSINVRSWKDLVLMAVLFSVPFAIIAPLVFFGFAIGMGLGWFLGRYVEITITPNEKPRVLEVVTDGPK